MRRLLRNLMLAGSGPLMMAASCLQQPPTCTVPEHVRLGVDYSGQEKGNWCWAAVTEMTLRFYKESVDQCEVAMRNPDPKLQGCACREGATTDQLTKCNNTSWPPYSAFGYTSRPSNPPLPGSRTLLPNEVYQETACAGRPFLFAWTMTSSVGEHIMVANGYEKRLDATWIWTLNPTKPCIPLPPALGNPPIRECVGDQDLLRYDFFDAWPAHHVHLQDITEIKKGP